VACELLPSLDAHFEALLAIDPIDAFRVHLPAFSPKENREPAVAIPWTRNSEFSKAHPKRRLVWSLALVSMAAAGPAGHAQGMTLAHIELRFETSCLLAALGWPQSFFRSTS
jgi:hypothetical protein